MTYPAALDSFATVNPSDKRTSPSLAGDFNLAASAVENIEATLGTNPQGSHGTVKARIAALEDGSGGWPPGAIVAFAGPSAPSGFLVCDGTSYLRADYMNLFDALGGASSPWGLPDGTHFKVPNLQLKFPMGSNGGSFPLGATGGQLGHSHSLPAHDHTGDPHTHHVPGQTGTTDGANTAFPAPPTGSGLKTAIAHTHSVTLGAVTTDGQNGTGNTGMGGNSSSGQADPPYAVVLYIVKT